MVSKGGRGITQKSFIMGDFTTKQSGAPFILDIILMYFRLLFRGPSWKPPLGDWRHSLKILIYYYYIIIYTTQQTKEGYLNPLDYTCRYPTGS